MEWPAERAHLVAATLASEKDSVEGAQKTSAAGVLGLDPKAQAPVPRGDRP